MKTIIVTGASSGIGEAIARKLANNDYQVVLVARNKEKLAKITDEINKESPQMAAYFQVDVSDKTQVESVINQVKKDYGTIYGYINNAGVMLSAEVTKGDIESWDQMIDVNIKGTLYGTSLVIPDMLENKSDRKSTRLNSS